jgi:hypothetical protein
MRRALDKVGLQSVEPSQALSSVRLDCLDRLDGEADALGRDVWEWSAQNSGSLESEGLRAMAERLLPRLARFPGAVERIQLGATPRVRDDGTVEDIGLGEALRLVVRPDAPIQIALTGHYDTVFAGDHPFQTPRWAEPNILNGPGVADMKGGILVMLAALEALEASDDAGCVGYTVLLSPDEEIGSPGSAPLAAETKLEPRREPRATAASRATTYSALTRGLSSIAKRASTASAARQLMPHAQPARQPGLLLAALSRSLSAFCSNERRLLAIARKKSASHVLSCL